MSSELDAGACFVGALMHLPAKDCAAPLSRVDDAMLDDPAVASVLHLVRRIVEAGQNPDPVVVSDFALKSGAISQARWPQLSEVVLRCYSQVPSPSMVGYYAQAVINQAARRALKREAERLLQAAEAGDLDDAFEVWAKSATKIEAARASVRGDA